MRNHHNGHMSKQVLPSMGKVAINTYRDPDGTFDPQVVRKCEKTFADRIIGQYAIGNNTREISDILEEQFGNRISAEISSSITGRVLSEIQSWKNRPFVRVYSIVRLDVIHYKVMDEKTRPETRIIIISWRLLARNGKSFLACTYSRARMPTLGSVCLRISRIEGFRICDTVPKSVSGEG